MSRGHLFEKAAESFLVKQGFEVVERNWRAGHKEIDLIMQRDRLLVFVEVKSSRSVKFGHPAERVDRRKVRNLIAAAEAYIQKNDVAGCDLRFDVIAFVNGKLEHYPDAFGVE